MFVLQRVQRKHQCEMTSVNRSVEMCELWNRNAIAISLSVIDITGEIAYFSVRWKIWKLVQSTALYQELTKKRIRRWETRTWRRSILLPLLRLTPLTERFPWDDLRTVLHGGQRMTKVQNGEKMLPKVSTSWVGCTNVTDIRHTTDRQTDLQ